LLRAVVFDFDGVLANSEPLHLQAFQAALAEDGDGLSVQEYYERYVGFDDEGVFRRIAASRGVPDADVWVARLVARKASHMQTLLTGRSPLFAGAAECVRSLAARVPVAIASGAIREEILQILERQRLAGTFTAIVAAGETPEGKPAPDPYARALELLSEARGTRLEPDTVVAIEDSQQGLLSARAAGLRTVGLATTFRAAELTLADLVLPGISAVTFERLSQLCGSDGGS
jgi:beta-phosphoglucomutase